MALETAVISTGLPAELRRTATQRMAAAVSEEGATPSFVGVVAGQPIVGLTGPELELLERCNVKLGTRDLPIARARRGSGGTAVSSTLLLAGRAGLRVAATGGIGGVHRSRAATPSVDISADLYELARTPIILVCSGPKAIVDIGATLERLETLSVTVVGFRTDRFPAFWSADSGLAVQERVESPADVASLWQAAAELQAPGAILVCVPPPAEVALSLGEIEPMIERALAELEGQRVSGPDLTPRLLDRIAEHTEGRTVRANLALLERNASVAAAIATAVHALDR